MNCETLQRAIDERRPGDTAGLPGDLAAHLEGCPACQAYAAGVAAIGHALAHCRDLAAALPEAELLAARERIAGAVAVRRAAAVRRQPVSRAPADPLLVWGTGLAVILLAAFIGVLAWPRSQRTGTLNAQRSTFNVQTSASSVERSALNVPPPAPAGGQPAVPPPPPAPESTKIATKLATKIEEPQLTGLPAFRAEYEALKASGRGSAPGFLQRFACYLEGSSRTLDERLQGWKLLCEACEEAGEKKRAVEAFGRHIDAFQDKYGTDKASIRTYQKVCEVYYAQKDKLGGLAYGDLILMRFPEGEMADRVQMLIGDYYESMRNYDAGIRQMQALIKLRPGTALAWRAKDNMARMFYNSKRPDEAISLWREMAEAATDNQRSEYYFRIGIHLYARGSSFYVEAMKCFRWVIENGKGPDYKRPAQEMLARINALVTGA